MQAMKVYVTPVAKMIVRDPDTGLSLPPEGAEVVWSTYWQRRLNDHDITKKDIDTTAQPAAGKGSAQKNEGKA